MCRLHVLCKHYNVTNVSYSCLMVSHCSCTTVCSLAANLLILSQLVALNYTSSCVACVAAATQFVMYVCGSLVPRPLTIYSMQTPRGGGEALERGYMCSSLTRLFLSRTGDSNGTMQVWCITRGTSLFLRCWLFLLILCILLHTSMHSI